MSTSTRVQPAPPRTQPAPIRTGQVWERTRDGSQIQIGLAIENEIFDDWHYTTVPSAPDQRARHGRIFGWSLRKTYTLVKESEIA